MNQQLDSNNHAVFSLNYHLVIVVKYRQRVLTQKILSRLREIAEYVGKNNNVFIHEMNGEEDHVHFLLKTKPNCDLSKYINAMKSASSRLIKKEFPKSSESSSKMITTYRYRMKDSGRAGKNLSKMAQAVNVVWNFCKQTQKEALKNKCVKIIENKKTKEFISIPYFLSSTEMDALVAGSSKELGLHS